MAKRIMKSQDALTAEQIDLARMLLTQHVKDLGSKQAAADDLGYSRTAVSLFLNRKYKGAEHVLAQAVLDKLGKMKCPFLQSEISAQACLEFREAEPNTQNPARMRHYRACQNCPCNPKNNEMKHD